MKEYIPPTFGSNLFTCPICGGNGQQAFLEPFTATESLSISHRVRHQIPYQLSQCKLCHGYAIWSNGTLIYPTTLIPPPPSEDMPSQTREDYEEARKVYSASAKANAAEPRPDQWCVIYTDACTPSYEVARYCQRLPDGRLHFMDGDSNDFFAVRWAVLEAAECREGENGE